MKQMERTQVIELNDVAMKVGSFDNAITTPLYGDKNGLGELPNHVGIFNTSTNQYANVASKGYNVIQHNDVAGAVTETLARMGLNVRGRLDNDHDRVKFDLIFTDNKYDIQDDAKGIKLGIRVINSYNKTTSFRLEMFGFRSICMNGMSFGRVMEVREITRHYGKEKDYQQICEITEKFIIEVINSSPRLQAVVSEMMRDSLEWESAKLIVENLIKTKKHQKAILDRLESCKTRWDLYNAITNYASHGLFLSPLREAAMEKISQKVLTHHSNALIKLCEVKA